LPLLLLFNQSRHSSSAMHATSNLISERSSAFSARGAAMTASPPTAANASLREKGSSDRAIDTLTRTNSSPVKVPIQTPTWVITIDLTIAIALCGAVVFVLASLRIDVPVDVIPYLHRFPLPIG
jgi:hypothetical protein